MHSEKWMDHCEVVWNGEDVVRGFDNADDDCADEMDWFYEPSEEDYAEMMIAFEDMAARNDHIHNV